MVVTAPSLLLQPIAEDGITGRTFNSQLIVLTLDSQQQKVTESFVFETLCHEMSHSLRWEKLPEDANTLFDSMILEGLAIALEEKAVETTKADEKQFFLREIQTTRKSVVDSIISQLSARMQSEQYDYDTIFFTGNDTLPRWAGYRLGYYLVKQYLARTGSTIFEATLVGYAKFR